MEVSYHNTYLIFTLLTLCVTTIPAQNVLVSSQAQVSARSVGMGSAFCAVSSDAAAFATNPAGVCLEKSFVLSGMYSSLHGTPGTPMANMTWAGCTLPQPEFSLSANWVRFQSADIPAHPTVPSGDVDQSEVIVKQNRVNSFLAQSEDAFSLTASRNNIVKIDWGWNQYVLPIEFPVGLTMRYTHAALFGLSASALSVDAGLMMRVNLRDMFFSDDYPYVCFGWTLRNIGGSVQQWKNDRTDFYPYHSTIGFAIIQPLHALESQCTFDYDHSSRDIASSRVGIEWKYRKFYFFRIGFYSTALCFGVGADLRFFTIDYAYQSSTETILGNNHHLNIAFRLERLFL